MSHINKFIIDSINRTASWELTNHEMSIVIYSIVNGEVTMGALSTTVLNFEEAKDYLFNLNTWANQVGMIFNLARHPSAPFTLEFEKEINQVKVKMISGGKTMINAVWQAETNNITVQSRPETVVPWATFLNFIVSYSQFFEYIIHF